MITRLNRLDANYQGQVRKVAGLEKAALAAAHDLDVIMERLGQVMRSLGLQVGPERDGGR